METKHKLESLNIQLFAEGGEGETGTEVPKTYTQEEMNKIIAERDKFKNTIDNLSKENAEYKRNAKNKLSEEEKKAQEDAEKEEMYAQILKDNRQLKMTSILSQGGYSIEETNNLVELIIEADDTKIVDYLCKLKKDLTENITKSLQVEFSKNNHVPNGGNGLSEIESEASKRAKNYNTPKQTLKVWGQFGK